MTFTDHFDPNLHWVIVYFIGLCNYWFRNHYFEADFFFFARLLMGNCISTSISPPPFRAGSPVVKAGEFHRGSRNLNSPEIFKNLISFSLLLSDYETLFMVWKSFYRSKSIKNYNRTTKCYIRAWARPFRQVRLKRFFYKHICSYVA